MWGRGCEKHVAWCGVVWMVWSCDTSLANLAFAMSSGNRVSCASFWPYPDIRVNGGCPSSPVPNQPACGLCQGQGQRCNKDLWCQTHACKTKHRSAGDTPVQMHTMACVAYLAAIWVSALLMPTLLAASTPCFPTLWLTSPFAEYPSNLPQGTPAT